MTAQIGGLSAQVTSLSQQVARLTAAAAAAPQPSVTTRAHTSARTPRTYVVSAAATGSPPVPPTKPTLKLPLEGFRPAPPCPTGSACYGRRGILRQRYRRCFGRPHRGQVLHGG